MGARTLKAQDTLSQAIAVSASIAAGCRTANDLARSSNAFLPRVLLLVVELDNHGDSLARGDHDLGRVLDLQPLFW